MALQIPQRTFYSTAANTSGLFDFLSPDYQLAKQKVDAARAFQGGLPTDASGNVDYGAMAKRLYEKGDFGDANNLLQTGLSQQMLRAAQTPSAVLGGGQPSAAPSSLSSSYTKPSPGFDSAVDRSLGFEGGMNPRDTNGTPSNFGINAKAHPGIDVANLSRDQAKQIYKSDYWDAIDGDNLPAPLSRAAFDTAIIAGPDKAKELIVASGGDPMKFMTLREQFQQGLIQSAPAKYGQYQKAWNARNNGLRYDILALNEQAKQTGAGAPVQPPQSGASDAPPPSSQHPYAPSSPPFQKGAGITATPPRMPPAGGMQQQAPMVPVGLHTAAADGAVPPQAPANPPPTRWASNGSTFVDPTLGGLVTPEQLAKYGSYGGVAKAAAAEAASLGTNPYAKEKAAVLLDYAKTIMSSVAKAQELTPEQKNSRDAAVMGFEQQKAIAKAQARVDAQNSTVAVQGAGARAEAAEEGKTLGQVPAQLATAADSARSQNAMIDEMLDASSQFSMGKFADKEQALNASMSALGHKLGVDTSSIDGKVAAYEDFGKLAGQFSRQAMKETGGRAGGIQELKFITNTLPSPTMSPAGFQAVGNQLKGLGDFNIAKQQAGEAWLATNGSMKGFDADWNKNVTPGTFVMRRLQVDQPEVFSTTVKRLAQSAQGRAALQNIKSGLTWAGGQGLLQ